MKDTKNRDQKITYNDILDRVNRSISARFPQSFGFVRRFAPILNVSPNTIYNKLSGRTRFSVEELFFILHDLNIPVSEIMDEFPNTEGFPMELLGHGQTEPGNYSDILDWYRGILSMAEKSENSRLMVLSNTIPEFSFIDLQWLSAFSLQKWLFYNKGLEAVIPLSQIYEDRTHHDQTLECLEAIRKLRITEYILSIDVMRNYTLELIMFYEYRIITQEEALHIYGELNFLLRAFEKVCADGLLSGTGKKLEIYYHSTQMFGSMHLLESDNIDIGIIYTHYLNPITSKNNDTFNLMKSWYNSWKHSSIPISMAGIKNRMDFIKEQEKTLDYMKGILGF